MSHQKHINYYNSHYWI